MAKPFYEVFPTLKLSGKVHDILEQTEVEKISATKRKDFLRIYLHSGRLIMKEDIRTAEWEIKRQLFPNANMTVKIYERFELSSQYTPEKLMDVYRDSILEELREYNHIDYNSFRTAELSYPDASRMILTLEDSVLARSREEELVRVLEKILVERCGFALSLQVIYKEAQTGKYAEDDEQKLRLQVAEIARRAGLGNGHGQNEVGTGLSREDMPSVSDATDASVDSAGADKDMTASSVGGSVSKADATGQAGGLARKSAAFGGGKPAYGIRESPQEAVTKGESLPGAAPTAAA